MSSHEQPPQPSEWNTIVETEAYQTLLTRASRRTGGIPPETIVRHVLSVTAGGDWPVQRDALEAVLRRCTSARTDDIRIVARPRGRGLGLYRARRGGSRTPPYRTLLRRVEPIDGSCECADYLRSALGLCKHLVAVLEDVASKPRRLDVPSASPSEATALRWDPVRPLTGPGDWLARVRWIGPRPAAAMQAWLQPSKGGRRPVALSRPVRPVAPRTRRPSADHVAAEPDGWTLAVPNASPERLALVEQLLGALQDGDSEPALHALLQRERAILARELRRARNRARLHGPEHAEAAPVSIPARGRGTLLRPRAPAPRR